MTICSKTETYFLEGFEINIDLKNCHAPSSVAFATSNVAAAPQNPTVEYVVKVSIVWTGVLSLDKIPLNASYLRLNLASISFNLEALWGNFFNASNSSRRESLKRLVKVSNPKILSIILLSVENSLLIYVSDIPIILYL